MSTGLGILSFFVLVVFFVGNLTEWYAHRPVETTDDLEDLRVAYAPDLSQVFFAEKLYEVKKIKEEQERKVRVKREAVEERIEHNKRERDRYLREIEEVRIKRWLEGNPVTNKNPLTPEEEPVPPQFFMGHYY